MTSSASAMLDRFRSAVVVLREVGPVDTGALVEGELVEYLRLASEVASLGSAARADAAGEVAVRSAPELGASGMAQRAGMRSAENFVKVITGVSGRDAVTAVRTGRLVRDVVSDQPAKPWLSLVAARLRAGVLTVGQADAIATGLREPDAAVTLEQLRSLARSLVAAAETGMDVDALHRHARTLRDELDVVGLRQHAEVMHERRSLTLRHRPDGMGELRWVMPPTTEAELQGIFDRMTSPKRSGVRFVGGVLSDRAKQIEADQRTVAQLASDGFEQLLRAGADADSSMMLGSGAPVVYVTVTKQALETGSGVARIQGTLEDIPHPLALAERAICAGSIQEVTFDPEGRPLDVGREQRTFTSRQKAAMRIRDGGCRAPDCDRPPGWCEAHHIRFWARDHGRTDIDDGILLCRHHHLLFHNTGWEITRDHHNAYWLIPPPHVDPHQKPVPMQTKSTSMRDLLGDRS